MIKIGDKIIIDRTFKGKQFIDTFELIRIEPIADVMCDRCGRCFPEKKFAFKCINSDDLFYLGTSCVKTIKNGVLTYIIKEG